MSLPTSRNTTYAPGSQVKSADMNACQDGIIALAGPRTLMIPAVIGRPSLPGEWPAFGALEVIDTTATAIAYLIPLLVESGQLVTISITLSQVNAVAGGTVILGRAPHSGGGTTTVVTTAIPTVAGTQTFTVVTNHAVVVDNAYALYVQFGAGSGDRTIRSVKVDYTRP
jgi:hypothetical protein